MRDDWVSSVLEDCAVHYSVCRNFMPLAHFSVSHAKSLNGCMSTEPCHKGTGVSLLLLLNVGVNKEKL